MSRGAQSFKQGDVTKAIKGAFNAGMTVKSIRIDKKNRRHHPVGRLSRMRQTMTLHLIGAT